MTYNASVVANKLLDLARKSGRQLTPMQLLKLVFLCHGWMLGLYGRPLISDRIEAWKYGPVIPSLYHAIKHFRGEAVTAVPRVRAARLSFEAEDLVQQVFDIYGDWSGPALSHLTHKRGSPWEQVFEEDHLGIPIPNGVIKRYYEQQAG